MWIPSHAVRLSNEVSKWPGRARRFPRRQWSCRCKWCWVISVSRVDGGRGGNNPSWSHSPISQRGGALLIRKVVRCNWSDEVHGSEYLERMDAQILTLSIFQPAIDTSGRWSNKSNNQFISQWVRSTFESHCQLFTSHCFGVETLSLWSPLSKHATSPEGNIWIDEWPDALLYVAKVMEAIRKGQA